MAKTKAAKGGNAAIGRIESVRVAVPHTSPLGRLVLLPPTPFKPGRKWETESWRISEQRGAFRLTGVLKGAV
jgi:hypothetical protein